MLTRWPFIGKGRGRQVIAVARTADVVIMMLDANKGEVQRCVTPTVCVCMFASRLLEGIWEADELFDQLIISYSFIFNLSRELLEKELESVGIRLNSSKPNIYFKVHFYHLPERCININSWIQRDLRCCKHFSFEENWLAVAVPISCPGSLGCH